MSSTDSIEANIVFIRADLSELKIDFRAAIARIDNDIRSAAAKLEGDIRVMAVRAERDLQQFADRFESQLADLRTDMVEIRADNKQLKDYADTQFSELRADNKFLREKVDRNYEKLYTKIDSEIKETHKSIVELTKVVLKIDSRLNAITWVGGGVVVLVTLAITVGQAFNGF